MNTQAAMKAFEFACPITRDHGGRVIKVYCPAHPGEQGPRHAEVSFKRSGGTIEVRCWVFASWKPAEGGPCPCENGLCYHALAALWLLGRDAGGRVKVTSGDGEGVAVLVGGKRVASAVFQS